MLPPSFSIQLVSMARLSLLALCVMHCASAMALEPVPEQASEIVDQTGALRDEDRKSLEARLAAFEKSGRAQIGILISRGIQDEPLAQFSLRVAERWQLGHRGRDDGLLVLVIPANNVVRIEVGYGLEGDIPDAVASRLANDLRTALQQDDLASGLRHLFDQIDSVLPKVAETPGGIDYGTEDKKIAYVLSILSLSALFPLLAGMGGNRWLGVLSAPLFAAMLGSAAWFFWNSKAAGFAVGGIMFTLPLFWALNYFDDNKLARWLQVVRAFGNVVAVAMFFSFITLSLGAAFYLSGSREVWAAPLFAGIMALGLAGFLFPKKQTPLMIVLRSYIHFLFILAAAYFALQPLIPQPATIAFVVAGIFTACTAIALYLDSRERKKIVAAPSVSTTRWSLVFVGLALIVGLPFGVVALAFAVMGDELVARAVQAVLGTGSIVAVLSLTAKAGLFTAIRTGLGGRFGGGGAGR